jgi:hypothetical protein
VSAYLSSIIYANSLFVIVGAGGAILTSADGIAWSQESSGTEVGINDITYGDNQYVAVGNNIILTSPDGRSWRVTFTSTQLQSITYGYNQYIATGVSGVIMRSIDGVNWTQESSGAQVTLYNVVAR